MSRIYTLAAGAAAATGVVMPAQWQVLGYTFPAGAMIVGLLAALMARVFVTRTEKGPRDRILDIIIMGVVLLTTAVWIATRHCGLWEALGTGLGFGTAGALILATVQSKTQAGLDIVFGGFRNGASKGADPSVGQVLRDAFPLPSAPDDVTKEDKA